MPLLSDGPVLPLRSSVHPAHFGLAPGAEPVRIKRQRGKSSSWSGLFSSPKALGPVPTESFLENNLATLISVDPRIKYFAAQPHELIYWMPGRDGALMKHRYTPDFVAVDHQDRILVIEAKASAFAKSRPWTDKEPYIREAYAVDHNAHLIVFTEEEIQAQPRLANCQLIHHHRGPPSDAEADLAMRDLVGDAQSEVMLGQLCLLAEEVGIDQRRSFSTLMRMVMDGAIGLDLSEPISASSRVSLGGLR
jgi:hypothetical protein